MKIENRTLKSYWASAAVLLTLVGTPKAFSDELTCAPGENEGVQLLMTSTDTKDPAGVTCIYAIQDGSGQLAELKITTNKMHPRRPEEAIPNRPLTLADLKEGVTTAWADGSTWKDVEDLESAEKEPLRVVRLASTPDNGLTPENGGGLDLYFLSSAKIFGKHEYRKLSLIADKQTGTWRVRTTGDAGEIDFDKLHADSSNGIAGSGVGAGIKKFQFFRDGQLVSEVDVNDLPKISQQERDAQGLNRR